jgi:hypothetical protein
MALYAHIFELYRGKRFGVGYILGNFFSQIPLVTLVSSFLSLGNDDADETRYAQELSQLVADQGCQISLGVLYQNRKKCNK